MRGTEQTTPFPQLSTKHTFNMRPRTTDADWNPHREFVTALRQHRYTTEQIVSLLKSEKDFEVT
jgi:hypothetical protein